MKKVLLLVRVLIIILLSQQNAAADITKYMDTVVVTATRTGQKNLKIPSNVSVITREQIEATNAQTVADVLKQSLGIYVSDFSTQKSAQVDIRGFGDTAKSNVLVLVDGRRTNSIDLSGPDFVQIPLEAVERIEVIRGGGSVLYGDNAVGGVVNIITKKGAGKLSGRLGANYGSYAAQSTDLELSGSKKKFSYYLFSKYNDLRGYRDNSDLLAKDYSARLGYDVSDKISVDLNTGWHDDIQELPGGITGAKIQELGRTATTSPQNISYTKDRYVKLGLNIDPSPQDEYFGNFIVDLHYRNRDVYDEFNAPGSLFHTKREIDTHGLTGKYVFDKTLFDREINFVTGVDYYATENEILGSRDNVDIITISKDEVGLFGYLDFELFPKVHVNGGSRWHRAGYTFNQTNAGAIVFQRQRPYESVSMGGMRYEYVKGSNLHWNVQQTFRFPTTDEWYSTANFPSFGITPGINLNLQEQSGIQYEVGVKHNFDDKALVTLTPYWIDNNDEIFFDPAAGSNSNYGETRRRGVEYEGRLDIHRFFPLGSIDSLELVSNYGFQDVRFVKGDNHKKFVPGVPRHQAGGGILIGFLENFDFSLMYQYTGSQFAINDVANTVTPNKHYSLLDAKVAFRHNNLEIFAGINNILNEYYTPYVTYSSFSGARNFFPAPGRNFDMGVNIKF